MNEDEKAKLKTILNYWVKHNEEHSQEFKEWAEKARASEESEVGDQISQAAEVMEKVNDLLLQAMNKLQGRES